MLTAGVRPWLLRMVILVSALAIWESIARSVQPSLSALLSSPSRMAVSLVEYGGSGLLVTDSAATFSAAACGLLIGAALGIVAGIVLSLSRTMAETLDPFMAALNSLPRPALAPLVIIWFGFGFVSKVLLAGSLVFFLMLYNTLAGVMSVDPIHSRTVMLLGANRWQTVRLLLVPSISSWIVAGLPNAVSYSLIGVIVGELVGSTEGLGLRLSVAAGLFDTDRVFAILVWLMISGGVLVLGVRKVERHVLRWRELPNGPYGTPAPPGGPWPALPRREGRLWLRP